MPTISWFFAIAMRIISAIIPSSPSGGHNEYETKVSIKTGKIIEGMSKATLEPLREETNFSAFSSNLARSLGRTVSPSRRNGCAVKWLPRRVHFRFGRLGVASSLLAFCLGMKDEARPVAAKSSEPPSEFISNSQHLQKFLLRHEIALRT
jgi:hypothetical protein